MAHASEGVNAQSGRTVTIRFIGGPADGRESEQLAICHRIGVPMAMAAFPLTAVQAASDEAASEGLAIALLPLGDPYRLCVSPFRTAFYERSPGCREARFIGLEAPRDPERICKWAKAFNWSPQRLEAALTTEWNPQAHA